ncbi:MAG: SPOR domain-containing protein [Candidatus Marinimicrobia bacterium]|nr:SPOR domain-containing protein [Candidatus Neomarinimicrobiota bacterium]
MGAQPLQQEYVDPSEIRKPHHFKRIRTILYSDKKVFQEDARQSEEKYVEISGYRVQLISTQSLQEALEIEEQADSLYEIPVYVDFESPNYKVRLGNYEDHDEARKVQESMQKEGFKYAWVVPSKIITVK